MGKQVALALLERLTGRVPVAAGPPALDDGDVPF
jgi:hypothetical protein